MVASVQTTKKLQVKSDVRGFCRGKGMKELDLAGKAVAWYCLEGPQTTGPGLFVLVPELAQRDLDISADDWAFYLELVVEELGWKWDAEHHLLWITDWFAWQPATGKKQLQTMLEPLALLPKTEWLTELAEQPPAELSPALQTAWTNWFFPAPPTQTAPETSTFEVEDPAALTPEMIPVIIRLWFRPRTPAYIQLRLHIESLHTQLSSPVDSPSSPPPGSQTTPSIN